MSDARNDVAHKTTRPHHIQSETLNLNAYCEEHSLQSFGFRKRDIG